MKPRPPRKRKVGVVTSDRMDKTIAVRVDWLYKVPKYGKRVRRHTTYYAHDEANAARVGDEVEIVATRPLSRLKRWRLSQVLRRGAMHVVSAAAREGPAEGHGEPPEAAPEGPAGPSAAAPADRTGDAAP